MKLRPMNVLLIISDQHRQDASGCYGNSLVKTPNIDALARSGIRFENAYCPQPLCGPSRGCMLTGTYSHTCNMYTHGPESVLPRMPTMGTLFREAGYRTAAFGKVHVKGEQRGGRDLGFDLRALRYYTYKYQDYIDSVGVDSVDKYAPHRPGSPYNSPGYAGRYNPHGRPCMLDEDLMYDNLATDRVIGFLHQKRDKPFMLWCGLEKPHPEWSAPARFHRMYHPDDMEVPSTYWEERHDLPPIMNRRFRPSSCEPFGAFVSEKRLSQTAQESLVRGAIASYYATISYLDWNIGRILDCLEQQGLRENTLVIYTTDHGENLFEHGLVQKHGFYEGAVRVPLIFSHPSLDQGASRLKITNLTDILPTMLALCDLQCPESIEGESRVAELHGTSDAFEGMAISDFYSFGIPERMIRTPEWKYIYSHGDGDQLYDMRNDPGETVNRVAASEYAATRNELRQRLLASWSGVPERWRREG